MAKSKSRPRGYMPQSWVPQPQTHALLMQVLEVSEQYREWGAMTVRQIFYRLVGQYGYPKDERAYSRLCEACVKGRRAGIIPFSAIRDDPEESHTTGGWDSPTEWWEGELAAAKGYSRNPHEGQPYRVELWCEAAGMAPMLAQMVRDYGVDVYSTGGFSSVTVTHTSAQRIVNRMNDTEQPTAFLHVGDFDPSGESIFNAMAQDIGAFVAADSEVMEVGFDGTVEGWFEPLRVALTDEQVREYRLPTAPPKKTDSRSNNWIGQTCQLEAMDPATLNSVVSAAVEMFIDTDKLNDIREIEKKERATLVAEVRANISRQLRDDTERAIDEMDDDDEMEDDGDLD